MFTTLCTKFISKNTFTKTFNSISILQQKQQTSQFSIKNATKNFSSRTIQFSSTTNWTLPVTGHLPTALAYSPVNHSLLDSPNKKNFLKDTNSELMLKANNQKSRSSTKKFSSNFTKLIAVGVNSQKRAFSTRIPKINEDQKVEQASFFQSFLQRGDHQWMMALLIGINVVVFLCWQFEDHKFMRQNFAVSWENIGRGRFWTIITSSFSHEDFFHLLGNMFGLYFLGSTVLQMLGPYRFLGLYLAGAVGCSAAHLTFAGKNGPPALGASGSVLSIVTVFGLTYPWQPITLLLFFIPVTMPAIALVGFYVVADLWGASRLSGKRGVVAHEGHLGGLAVGAAYWFTRIRGRYRPY